MRPNKERPPSWAAVSQGGTGQKYLSGHGYLCPSRATEQSYRGVCGALSERQSGRPVGFCVEPPRAELQPAHNSVRRLARQRMLN